MYVYSLKTTQIKQLVIFQNVIYPPGFVPGFRVNYVKKTLQNYIENLT